MTERPASLKNRSVAKAKNIAYARAWLAGVAFVAMSARKKNKCTAEIR